MKFRSRSGCATFNVWDLDHPNLYRVITEVVDSTGKSIESSEDTFGLREVEIRDRHLLSMVSACA